jgi:hypothetical protein
VEKPSVTRLTVFTNNPNKERQGNIPAFLFAPRSRVLSREKFSNASGTGMYKRARDYSKLVMEKK